MKSTQPAGQSVGFTVSNGNKTFSESDCPPGILPAVQKAIKRGKEQSGVIAGGGILWRWELGHDRMDSVRLELQGQQEEYFGTIEIPRSKWEKFAKVAHMRDMSATEFLLHTLEAFVRINHDCGYEEAVALLMGEHCEERTYYVGPSAEFSAPSSGEIDGNAEFSAEVHAPAMQGRSA